MSNEQIPKTARAVVFDECNGAIRVDKDHAVTQANELKAGEALVKVEYTGVCRASNFPLRPLVTRWASAAVVGAVEPRRLARSPSARRSRPSSCDRR